MAMMPQLDLLAACFRRLPFVFLALATAIFSGCFGGGHARASRSLVLGASPSLATNAFLAGPTVRLLPPPGETASQLAPTRDFLYFVPLISPDPVTVSESPHPTSMVRFTRPERSERANHFEAHCDFEFLGAGRIRDTVDNSGPIHRNEEKLKAGGVMEKQLAYIQVEGPGRGTIEVEGNCTNQEFLVTAIRLHFDRGTGPSPVSIGLTDIRYVDGEYRANNDLVARVNTLTFKAGNPRMEVSVGSVNREEASDSLWQKLKGGILGAAANMFIKPMKIDPKGHETMLEFGRALAMGADHFTFPSAKRLTSVPLEGTAGQK